MPNLKDIQIGAIQGGTDEKIDALVKQLNEWGRLISNEARTRITKDDAGTQRLLDGYQQNGFSNGNIGAKLSQEGVDVLTASPDELIWSTDFNSFKIVSSGEIVIPGGSVGVGTSATFSSDPVEHSLGYPPAVLAYIYRQPGEITVFGGISFPVFSTGASIDIGVLKQEYFNATNTEVVFSKTLYTSTGGGWNEPTATLKYFILAESAPTQ